MSAVCRGCSSSLHPANLRIGSPEVLIVEAIDDRVDGGVDKHQVLREVREVLGAAAHALRRLVVLLALHHKNGEWKAQHHKHHNHYEERFSHASLIADSQGIFATQNALLIAIQLGSR